MTRFVRGLKAHGPLVLPTWSFSVPHLTASSLDAALQPHHVQAVHRHLRDTGLLKITLGFRDDESRYLEALLLSLSRRHGHGLPVDHSASRGWFWDVRPSAAAAAFQSNGHRARSETMRDFPWHTDCSYEARPPRFFALQVLRPDARGGGTFSALSVPRVVARLSGAARAALARPAYRIEVPPEFVRAASHVVGSLLSVDEASGAATMRYRGDITTPVGLGAAEAMAELEGLLRSPEVERETLRLRAESLPRGSLLLLDNRRWLHARDEVRDPERHLRRVRWDAVPFEADSG